MFHAMGSVLYLVLIGLNATGASNSPKTNCNLPEHPRNGYYMVERCDIPRSELCKNVPGTSAEFGTVIAFACHQGYQLQGLEVNYCSDGVWNPRAPTCEPVVEAATLPGECKLPETPSHGSYAVRGCRDQHTSPACTASPASLVKSGTVLDYNCEGGYNIRGNIFIECVNGNWTPDIPTCPTMTCKPLFAKTLDIACSDGTAQRKEVPCNLPVPVGTRADLMCKGAYKEFFEPGYRTIRCLPDGTWDNPPFQCAPICGKRTSKGQPLIANGEDTKVSDFPWHVGIYTTLNNHASVRCGGTLVSPGMIVTAAQCLWDDSLGIVLPVDTIKVVAGKYYADWNAKDEPEKQIRQVSKIHAPETYQGSQGYFFSNIAALVLNEDFKLTWAVQPICVDWDNSKERIQLRDGNIGSIVGWEMAENDETKGVLKTANMPYVNFETCWKETDTYLRPYITRDKFCAGYPNGTALCHRDVGGGLAFEYDGGDRSTKLWYLQGVLSVGSRSPEVQCETHKYTIFTKLSKYTDQLRTLF